MIHPIKGFLTIEQNEIDLVAGVKIGIPALEFGNEQMLRRVPLSEPKLVAR